MTLSFMPGDTVEDEITWSPPPPLSEPIETGETDINQVHRESSRMAGNPDEYLKGKSRRRSRERRVGRRNYLGHRGQGRPYAEIQVNRNSWYVKIWKEKFPVRGNSMCKGLL